ncbi:TRAP-like protein [Plasmodium berghei]|uniref:TRAP-like protein n=1 Tax=Plasmodium berghei TaxID=5821 RepID=A0A1D3LWJ1_PLABE|nr:TRAP-like protein [Plasmodium berghei]
MNIHFLISAEEVNSKEFLKHLIYAIMGTVNYMILSIGNVISVSIFDEKIVYKNIKAIGKIKKQSFASEIEEAYNKYVHYEAKETNLKNSIIDYHENVILSDPVMKNQKNVLIICKAFDEKDLTDYSDETVNFIRDKRDQNLGIYFISENTLYSSNIVYKLSETRLDEDGLYPLAHLLSGYYDNRLVISVKKFCYHLTYGSLCTKYNDWSDWFGSCEFRQRRKEIPLNITRTEASNFLRYYTPTCSNAFDYTISVKEDFKIDCPNVIYNCRGTCDAGYKFKPYVSDNEIVERYVECKDLPPCTEEQRNSRDEYEHIHIIKDLNDKAQETEYQDIIERRVIEKKRKGETEAQASARKVKEINAFIDNRVKVMLNKQYALLNINPPGYEEETKGNSEDLTDTRKISEILPPKYTVPDNPTLKKHPSEDTYSKKEGDNREAHKDGQVIKVIEKDHLKQNGEVEKKISETNNDSDGNITKNPTDIQILEKKQLKGNNKHTDDSIDGAQDWDKYEGNVIVENKEMKGIDKNTDKITIDNNMKVDNTYEMKGALIYTTVEREGNNGSVEPNKQKLSKEKEELESNKEKNEDKQIFPDKTKSETEKKDKEIIRDQELNKITQNGNVENIVEVIPAHETKTVEEYKPLDESRVVEEVIPVNETKTVEEYKPLNESRVIEEYKPLDETKTVEEYKPLDESRVVEDVIPVHETKTVEEYKPLDESRVVEEVIPVHETKTVEEYKPLDESRVVEEVIPVNETKTVEEYKPLYESRVIEEYKPLDETKTVEEYKPLYESRVIEGYKPLYETKTVEEYKPLYESRVIEEHKPLDETKTVEEYKPLDESRVVEEVIPVHETKTVEEYKPLYESRVVEDVIPVHETKTVEEYKPLDESRVVEEYKPLDESRVVEEVIPVHETKTIDEHKPLDESNESRVVEEVIPVNETKTVEEYKPLDESKVVEDVIPVHETKTVEEYKPLDESRVVEEYKPLDESRVVEEVIPVHETKIVEEYKPLYESRVIEEYKPLDETKTVEEYKPLYESRVIEEHKPLDETKTVEEYKPLDESRVVEEYKPLNESRVVEEVIHAHETKTVEEYKPLDESRVIDEHKLFDENRVVEEVIPAHETKKVEEYKPLYGSRVIDEDIPAYETKTVDEHKPLDESIVVEEVIPVHETKTIDEHKPLDESRVIEEDIPAYETKTVDKHKLFDESRVVEEVIPAYESKTVDERKLVDSIDANDIIGKGESIYDNKIIQGNDEWISDKDEAIENLDGYESTKSTNYSDNSDDNEEGKSIFPNKNIDLSTSNVINDQSKIIYTDKSVNKTINSDPNENIHTESRKEDIQKESENNKDMISHIPDDRIIHRVANNGEKKLLIDEKNIEDILGKDLNVDNSEGGSNEYNTIDMEHKEDSTLDEHNNIEKNDNNGKISEHSSEDKSYTIDIKVDRDTLPHDSINIQKTKDEAAIKKEEADTKKDEAAIKKEEVDIKKGEAAIKKYEVDIKKGEAVIKKEEADTKKDEAAIKKEEVDIKKDEAAIKKEEVDIKKDEAAIKKYEVDIKKGEAAIKKEEAVSMHNEIDPKKLIIEDNTNCPPNITTIKEKCDEVPKKSDVNPERTIIKDKDYVSTEKSNIEKNDVIDNSDDFSINEIISAVVNEHVNSNDAESKYDTNEKLGILDDFVEKSKKASGEKNDYPYKYYSDTKSIHKIFFKKSQGKIDENKYMIVGQNNYIIDSKDIKNPFHKNMSNNVDKILGEQIQKDIKSTFEGYNNDEKEKSKSSNNRILKLAGMSLFGAVFIVFMSMYMLKKINSYKLNENTIMNFEYDEAPKNIINNDKGEEVTCGDISYVNDDWS